MYCTWLQLTSDISSVNVILCAYSIGPDSALLKYSWNGPPCSRGLRGPTLCLIAQISAINIAIMLTIACRLEHTLPLSQNIRPFLPTASNIFSLVAAMFSDDIIPHRPWRNRDIDQAKLLAKEIRAFALLC